MANRLIQMNWVNDTNPSMQFVVPSNPTHGTYPTATNNPMGSVGTSTNISTVSANQNDTGTYGPQGTYQWEIVGSNPTSFINVSYNHPEGTGTTSVQVNCPSGYLVSSSSNGPSQNVTFTDSSLQQHNASITITIAQTATGTAS